MGSRRSWPPGESAPMGRVVAFACAISAGVHAGLNMADMISGGIIRQFPAKFS